jgi:hypothetical protein
MGDAGPQGRRAVPAAGRRVAKWALIGGAVGLILGIVIGVVFATPGRFGFWMAIVATTIFFGAVCAFTAGIASLGSPPPGEEPSDAASAADS